MSELVDRVRAYGETADVVALCAAYGRLEAQHERIAAANERLLDLNFGLLEQTRHLRDALRGREMDEKRRRNEQEDACVQLEAGP